MKRKRKCGNVQCRRLFNPPERGRPPRYCSPTCRVAAWRDINKVGGSRVVAALYVEDGGHYFGVRGVRPWAQERDARRYPGPHPVIAHPPCARWSMLATIVQHTHGHKLGDDGGCFQSALDAVRRWGGVLEHPLGSHAWRHHGIEKPPPSGGWVPAGDGMGWTCSVDQHFYGHPARKRTWLYAAHTDLPMLRWGAIDPDDAPFMVHSPSTRRPGSEANRTVNKKVREVNIVRGADASRTPAAFMDVLIDMARSVNRRRR